MTSKKTSKSSKNNQCQKIILIYRCNEPNFEINKYIVVIIANFYNYYLTL